MKTKYAINLFRLILFLFFIPTVCAQPICQIQHFSIYNGLPQRAVTSIVQDNKGFIWFATWNGLSKFDGYTYKNYKAYPGDGCTLTSNRLSGITPNRYNNIWCQSYDRQVYLFDSQQEKFIDILYPIRKEAGKNSYVTNIYVLPKGITWIVCEYGAFRVDEEAYREKKEGSIVYHSPEDGNLPGGKISDVRQDADGDEWIFTDNGVQIIGKKTMPGDIEFKASCENDGNIYLLSANNRLAIYKLKDKQLQFKKIPYEYTSLTSIHTLEKDLIAIGTDSGFMLYKTSSNQFEYVGIPGQDVQHIHKDSHNELWIFSLTAGVTRYNPATGEKQHYVTPPQDMPQSEQNSRDMFFEDSQGTVWVVPHQGSLSYYDRKSRQLRPYYSDPEDSKTKFTPLIRNYFIDRQKNLWYAGKSEMGRLSFFPNACRIQPLDYGFETRAFLTDSRGNLWMANKKGVIRILHADGSLKGYLAPDGHISPREVAFSKSIYCFMEDAKGNIWMGSKWDGLFLLKRTGDDRFRIQSFAQSDSDPYSLSNNSVYSICQDSHGRIWIGTYGGGPNLLEETADGNIRFLHSGNRLKGYPKGKYAKTRIIRQVEEALLIGTTEGLVTFTADFKQPEDIRFFQNTRMPNIASSLCSNDVTYIYTDSRKQTYVLSFTGGINCVLSSDLLTDHIEFQPYTLRNGASSDLLLSMIEDAQKQLWVISENALDKFDPENGTFTNYNKQYQQQEVYFSEAHPVIWHNRLIAGTEAGIMEVSLNQLKKSSYSPHIAFTGLKIQGILQHSPIDDLTELRLRPSERNVTFQFAALDYIAPSFITYQYRLKGLEEQWNEVDNNRTANYINLPPGNYELQIRSTNSDGIWTDNTRTLPIVVLPTFWETSWAWVLYILVFILFTATIVYIFIYIYRLHHQIDLEHQLTNIKLRFFTDISHELRTPLTLITSPVSEVLEHEALSPNARKHLTLVHSNTERMLRLVNQILDFRKIENQKMKVLLEKTDITALLQRVTDDFHLIAEEKHIDFRLQTQPDTLYGWADRDKLEKIVFNLLSNAFKYTPANKSITVLAEIENGNLNIIVKDEGIGIDLQRQQRLFQRFETLVHHNILQPSSGIGLSLVKELIELQQGSIRVNSKPGAGSEFLVTLPITPEAYKGKENTELILDDTQPSAEQRKPEEVPERISPTEGITTDEPPLSVLIVEDNVELKGFLHSILAETYRVIEASNGQEGLENALQHLPDFIISDIMMPVMDGLDMVKAIKENRDICHIPIILLSAKSSLDDRISGLEQGIDDYITKPFSSTYLKARIKSLLLQRKQLQELYLKQWSEKQQNSNPPEVSVEIMPSQPQIVSFDEQFMQQVMEVMEKQMDNSELTIDEFAQALNMGRTVFYQKLKAIIGLSPVDFIREIRIKRAKQLMDSNGYNVSTVAYMTGFNDPKYFSKCFKKQVGVSPSEYCKEKKAGK